ncbi:MAG: IS630 family transposase [Waterburya sp.]
MPKKVYLAQHYSSTELKEKYLKSRDTVEARRWHLLWKISLGWTIKNSAVAVGYSYRYAQKILKRYNRNGEAGIINQKNKTSNHLRGKKRLLNCQQLEKLKEQIEQTPTDGGIWTGAKVARWIEKETGRGKVWNQRGWDYLKKCSYSWQTPRPAHQKADKLEQEIFKANFPIKVAKLEAKNPGAEIDVWFFDEHRVGLKPILKKVWSKIGNRPTAIVNHRYEWLYVYGFVQPKTGATLWYLIPRVNTNWLNVVYQQFARDAGISAQKKILLIEDNAGWHRSQKVTIPQGIEIEFLPPYSPELQPAERLWQLVDEPLANQYFETIDEIEELLAKRCCVLNDMKDEIRNLTNYHWL